jgi:superfamily II DNA or RNA helicase
MVPVSPAVPERQEQYAAGLRALQEAFAIDIAEREDRHRAEMHALQQSFANDVAGRDNHHRAELHSVHQRFTADIAAREERHKAEIQALQRGLDELRAQLTEAGASRGRDAEGRATVEAELEWHRGELKAHRDEIIRLKTHAADLGNSLQGAQQHGERWTQEARRLEADLRTTHAEAGQAAASASAELDQTNAQLFDTIGRLEVSQEQVARLTEQSQALEVAGSQLRQTIVEQRAVRERLTDDRDAARQQAGAIEAQLRTTEFEAEQAAEDAARQLSDAERRRDTADESVARLTGQISVHEATIEEQREVLAEQQGALKKLALEHDSTQQRIAELEAELAVLQRKIDADAKPSTEPTPASPAAPPQRKPATTTATSTLRQGQNQGQKTAPPKHAKAATPAATPVAPASKSSVTATQESLTQETLAEQDEDDRPVSLAEGMTLAAWQREALAAWSDSKHRGVVEAITSGGLTRVAHWAIGEALDQDMKVLVLVPTADRVEEWYEGLRQALPINRVGKHNGGKDDRLATYDVVVSTADAAARDRVFGLSFKGLLVADDVHEFGTPETSLSLDLRYAWRLGLTTDYERSDDGIPTYLDPYFGEVSFTLGYEQGLADGVVAPFDLALISLRLTASEQAEYDALRQQMQKIAAELINGFAVSAQPHEAFTAEVAALAGGRVGPARSAARTYQKAVTKQAELVATNAAKEAVLKTLAGSVRDRGAAIIYVETQEIAGHVARLFTREGCAARPLNTGSDDLALLVGPRTLLAGSGLPSIDLAIMLSASNSKRQAIAQLDRLIRGNTGDRSGRVIALQVSQTTDDERTNAGAPFTTTIAQHARATKTLSASDTIALTSFLA